MIQISKYLTLSDVEKSPTAKRKGIDNTLPKEFIVNAIRLGKSYDIIYEKFDGNVILSSFYRSIKLNTTIGGSKTSDHCTASAFDVEGINGVKNSEIFDFCKTLNFYQLINEYPTNNEPDWVHFADRGDDYKKEILKVERIGKKVKYTKLN